MPVHPLFVVNIKRLAMTRLIIFNYSEVIKLIQPVQVVAGSASDKAALTSTFDSSVFIIA
jgi:hypothetical protein